jgi:hypothetical protein
LRRFALALIASQKRSLSTAAIIAISASGAFAAQAPATDCHGSLPETFVREAALKIVGDLRNELSQGKELSPGVGRIFLDRLHSVLKKRLVYIQFCNEVRQGYLVTYVNDIERERARVAVKAIEKAALAEQADLDTDAIWTLARKAMVGKHAYQEQCRVELEALLRNSPVPTYDIRKP